MFMTFKYASTRLSDGVIEDLWMTASRAFSQRIYQIHDLGKFAIPGLEEAVRKGSIIPGFGQVMAGPDRREEIAFVREYLVGNLGRINDVDNLYVVFRNALFEYWQKAYGVFTDTQGR